jgi:hypothetical protein
VNMLRMQSSQTWQAETPGALNSQHFIPCPDDGPARAVTGSHAATGQAALAAQPGRLHVGRLARPGGGAAR